VGERRPSEGGVGDLVRLMVGREVSATYRQRFCQEPGEAVLEVDGLSAENGVRNASLSVRAGEIVGLAGLIGAGRTELARAIFGADRRVSGEIRLHGKAFRGNPTLAVGAGMGLVPEDRKTQGLALVQSVQDNLLAAGLRRLFPSGWYRRTQAASTAANLVTRLEIETPSTQRLVRFLSGGNQQKVVIGKWLATGSRLFIFDEPTRGIDVGAKAEIYSMMESLVANGAAVLMISSELPEMIAVCDRVYVMRDKTIVGELGRHELSEENILRLAMHPTV
jgi:ribose transport system ATP-binding protein